MSYTCNNFQVYDKYFTSINSDAAEYYNTFVSRI